MVRKAHQTARTGWVILLVDDDPAYLEATRMLIEREGHRVLTADSGERALAVLAESHVDLLLLDFYMRGMTGEAVVAELRKTNAMLQVILQTGYATEQPPRQLLKRLDIQGYHDKSDGPDKLLMWVDVGLKAAWSTQLVHKSRQGLRHILDAAPAMHRMQPLPGLLQAIIDQVTDLFGVAHAFLAMQEDDAGLVVEAATGRYAGSAHVPGARVAEAMALAVQGRRTLVKDDATIVPLHVAEQVLGVICLDKAIRGEPDGEVLSVFANQAAVAIQNAQLFEMATVDPLTGVRVRRFVEQWAIGELRKAYRHPAPFTLMMVDMDGLKRINDDSGHLAGDQALATMGQVLRAIVRESDVAGRFGGDEFIAVLPDTGEDGAAHVVARLLAQLEDAAVDWQGQSLPVRGSVGVATLVPPPPPFGGPQPRRFFEQVYRQLFEAADAALYEAKRAGRGRRHAAPPSHWPAPPAG